MADKICHVCNAPISVFLGLTFGNEYYCDANCYSIAKRNEGRKMNPDLIGNLLKERDEQSKILKEAENNLQQHQVTVSNFRRLIDETNTNIKRLDEAVLILKGEK